jgi:hypothetical protein
MAEALATVSVVASIVQLVDFSIKVVRRIEEFRSDAGEIPEVFRHINTEIPLMTATLEQIQKALSMGSIGDGTKNALLSVIGGCHEQVTQLDTILAKTLPDFDDNWRKRSKKALISLSKDADVKSITKILHNYIRILTFYCAAASSTLQPITGKCITATKFSIMRIASL